MKKFKNFSQAFDWAKEVINTGSINAQEVIAEQIYKDSNEFTYRESGEMYKSGEANSQFKKGLITERSPYVRRRYFEGGKPGAGNRKAQPRWFDKTVDKYKDDYKKMGVISINQVKE